MRILINYPYKDYPVTTGSYLEMALRKYPGIETFRIGENRIPCADLIINVEQCEVCLSYPGKKACYWEIDNHIRLGRQITMYEPVDRIFIAQKDFIPLYPANKTTWLPVAADPDIHKLYPEEPLEWDVGFIGNDTYPERKELLNRIGKKYKLLRTSGLFGEDYSRTLSRCKIIFNRSMYMDVNMRVFEAISIGRLLLTDKVEGQDDLLKDGEHYVSYNDWPDLDKKIEYYLNHEEIRNKIAKTGSAFVRACHTYKDRLETILKTYGLY